MSTDELEAEADKRAYPWECVMCTKVFHYPRRRTGLGDICEDCWRKVKQRMFEEVTKK